MVDRTLPVLAVSAQSTISLFWEHDKTLSEQGLNMNLMVGDLENLEAIVGGPRSDSSVASAQKALEDYVNAEHQLEADVTAACPS